MAHIRITRPDNLTGEMQVLTVNKVSANGDITPYVSFVNDETPLYNMITLCMSEHGIHNEWEEELRAKYATEIKTGFIGKLLMFSVGDETFITAPVTDEKGNVIWDED